MLFDVPAGGFVSTFCPAASHYVVQGSSLGQPDVLMVVQHIFDIVHLHCTFTFAVVHLHCPLDIYDIVRF
jgi:hypothetical protein